VTPIGLEDKMMYGDVLAGSTQTHVVGMALGRYPELLSKVQSNEAVFSNGVYRVSAGH